MFSRCVAFIGGLFVSACMFAAGPAKLAHFDVMPKVVALPDGTLASIVILHRGPGLEPTPAEQDVLIQYSKDGGRTWSDREAVVRLPTAEHGAFGFGINFVDRDGEIHVFLLCDGKTGVIRARTQDGVPPVEPIARQILNVWHLRSSKGRTTWSAPKLIFDKRTSDLQGVTQLKSGRIILPVSGWVNRSWRDRGEGFLAYSFMGSWDATVVYSDDGGETWRQSPSLLRVTAPNIPSMGAIEPVVVQLNDGRVWMLIRNQMGRFYESFSADGAEWSPPVPSNIVSSDSPAALLRLDEKRILMLWNPCQRYAYAQGGRQALLAAVTDDDGKTWRGYREVVRDELARDPSPPSGDHGVSYPYVCRTADGNVVFSMWVQTGEGRSVYGFDPNWLLETSQSDTFSEDQFAWSIFGSRGVEVADVPDAEDGKALRIAKVESDWPAGAVRNFPIAAKGRLTMRIKADRGAGPMHLVLTDHFSPPFDLEDAIHGVFETVLGESASAGTGLTIPSDRWATLTFDFDTHAGACRASLDGAEVAALNAQRAAAGLCYVRLRASATPATAAGYAIDRLEVQILP